MNNGYSYVGVPATAQEVMVKVEDFDHPVESSETLALAGPKGSGAPEPRIPTVVGLFLLSNDISKLGVS